MSNIKCIIIGEYIIIKQYDGVIFTHDDIIGTLYVINKGCKGLLRQEEYESISYGKVKDIISDEMKPLVLVLSQNLRPIYLSTRTIFISRRTDAVKGIDCLVVEVVAAGIEVAVEADTLVVVEEDMVAASSSYQILHYSCLASSLVVVVAVVVAAVVLGIVVVDNCRCYLRY